MRNPPNAKNIIGVDQAIQEIKQACESKPSPFFFLAGAGVSSPSIPLADKIQQQCEATARELGRSEEPPASVGDSERYSHWFTAAFPHRAMRQKYLRKLIDKALITHATFRLADLLLQGRIAHIAVTPNFDDLLQRAINLFGERCTVCDDPRTVERIDSENDKFKSFICTDHIGFTIAETRTRKSKSVRCLVSTRF